MLFASSPGCSSFVGNELSSYEKPESASEKHGQVPGNTSANATCPRIPLRPPSHLDSTPTRPLLMFQNKSNTKSQWEYSSRKASKITKDLNYLSIIGKVHQIAEKLSLSFSPDLPIETLSAPSLRYVMRPVPNKLNPSNWKQPCLAFGLGYFHQWTVGAKTYILPRKTFL